MTPRVLLLVDDDADIHVLLKARFRRLARADLRLIHAHTVPEALAALPSALAELAIVFSDVRMPGEDGHALLRHLRAAGYDGPFILIGSLLTDNHQATEWVEKDRIFERFADLVTRYVPAPAST